MFACRCDADHDRCLLSPAAAFKHPGGAASGQADGPRASGYARGFLTMLSSVESAEFDTGA